MFIVIFLDRLNAVPGLDLGTKLFFRRAGIEVVDLEVLSRDRRPLPTFLFFGLSRLFVMTFFFFKPYLSTRYEAIGSREPMHRSSKEMRRL